MQDPKVYPVHPYWINCQNIWDAYMGHVIELIQDLMHMEIAISHQEKKTRRNIISQVSKSANKLFFQ